LEVADTLSYLSDVNRLLGLREEGIQQAKEASEICEQLNYTFGRAHSLGGLAWLLYDNQQLDAAEEAASRSIGLLSDEVDRVLVCSNHRVLGKIHSSKGEIEKAINHFEAALRTASSLDWHFEQCWAHLSLAELFFTRGRFDDSHTHVERAKSHAVNDTYLMGCAMNFQAWFWYQQRRFRKARLEALCAANAYERVGATTDLERCRNLIRGIKEKMEKSTTSRESDPDGKLLDTVLLATHIDLPF